MASVGMSLVGIIARASEPGLIAIGVFGLGADYKNAAVPGMATACRLTERFDVDNVNA